MMGGLPEWPEMAIAPQHVRDLSMRGGGARAAGDGDRTLECGGRGTPLELGLGLVFDINSL